MANVVHASPLIASFRVDVPTYETWACESFDGISAMVDALASVQSKEFVEFDSLQKIEAAISLVAPTLVVNPRGQSDIETGIDVDVEDDLPCMNRFEVVMKESWALDLAATHPSFAKLAQEMQTMMCDVTRAPGLKSYWRLIISFPGANAQRWYADCVESEQTYTCEVELTENTNSQTVFPLDGKGEPVDVEGVCNSELRLDGGIIYSGDVVHFYDRVDKTDNVRVLLQLVMSANGDPNDGIPSDEDTESFDE